MDEQTECYSYQMNLEDNIELRKAVSKLEDLLAKKHSENDCLLQIHNDLKNLNEKLRKEVSELNHKYLSSLTDKKNQEKKHDMEINKLKNFFEKQKEIYESQLLKLNTQDSEVLKHKLSAEFELKNKHLIRQKDQEIENLNDQIFEWKRKFELLQTDYESFKNDSLRELTILKDNHRAEVKEYLFKIQILNDKCESNSEKESNRNLKQELDSYRRNFSDLQSEITNLRREKELILTEKNEIKMTYLKELDSEKLKSKVINNENDKILQNLKTSETEIHQLKIQIYEKNDEIKSLLGEKSNLSKENKLKDTEHESLRSEVVMLKQKVLDRERENESLLREEHEKEKHRLIEFNSEKEESKRKIDELTRSLREVNAEFKNCYDKANEDLQLHIKDFYAIKEEKLALIKKTNDLTQELEYLKTENTKYLKIVELHKDCENIQKSFRDLCNVEAESIKVKNNLENEIKNKNEEIQRLENLVKSYELQTKANSSVYYEKYQEAIKKKKYYKQQVIT